MKAHLKIFGGILTFTLVLGNCRRDESKSSGVQNHHVNEELVVTHPHYGDEFWPSSIKSIAPDGDEHSVDIADKQVPEKDLGTDTEQSIEPDSLVRSTDHLRAYFASLPPGRERTIAVHKMLGEAANKMDIDHLRQIYEALPLGTDRTVAGSKYAQFLAKRHGLTPALKSIAAFETQGERIESLINLMMSEEFQSSTRSASVNEQVDAIKETLDDDHRQVVDAILDD